MKRAVRVLVVDDDAAIRMLCRVNLELDGYAVVEAASADEARAALSAGPPDAVLLDVHIGGVSGLELIEAIRAAAPDAGIALLTGSAEHEALAGAGADAIIAKPFTIEELRETVERLSVGSRA